MNEMMYVKNTMPLEERVKLDATRMEQAVQATEQEKQAAKLDYIAMMADIDLSDIADDEETEEATYE